MLFPTLHVMVEYRTLLMKMTLNIPTNDEAKENFNFFVMCRFVGAYCHSPIVVISPRSN